MEESTALRDDEGATLTDASILLLARYAGLSLSAEDLSALAAQLRRLLPELHELPARNYAQLVPAVSFRCEAPGTTASR